MRTMIDVRALSIMGLLIAIAGPSAAQPPDPPAPPAAPATSFVMPDVPDNWNRFTSYDGRRFSVRFSFVALLDYNSFSQNDASVTQVGEQENEWDLRTWRLMARGRL